MKLKANKQSTRAKKEARFSAFASASASSLPCGFVIFSSLKRLPITLTLTLALLLSFFAISTNAGLPHLPQPSSQQHSMLQKPGLHNNLQIRRARLSVQEAVVIAEEEYEGRALGVKRVAGSGGTAYKVRILQASGKVKNVLVQGPPQ